MKATVREAGKVRVIELKGRITLGAGDLELRKVVQDELDKGNLLVALNLAGVEYIDSAGLGELVACKKRASAKGGDVKLIMPSESVYKVLSIVSLHLVFEIFDSEAKAIGSF
jgi:anti-sigma B factor antagonist